MITFGKGDQRVEVAENDTQLITYYTAEGWDEVSEDAEPVQAPSGEVQQSGPSPDVPAQPAVTSLDLDNPDA